MAWPLPANSKAQVNKAGEILSAETFDISEKLRAFETLTNWRACHGYPINTFQATLRNRLLSIDPNALVAQRLKRAPSIVNKLRRFPEMKLARMQDIGGLRAVVGSMSNLRDIAGEYQSGRLRHELVSIKDYVQNPKNDGYRSIHLVFKYNNPRATSYNGLMLELQLRTKLQHAWATAVETMGIFLDQPLKSNQGDRQWLEFFEVASSAFSHLESSPLVPNYTALTKMETFTKLVQLESQLHVLEKLKGFTVAADQIPNEKQHGYHLVILDPEKMQVSITSYARTDLEKATHDYANAEKENQNGEKREVVLVSAGPVESLKRAYPNYFLDTASFIEAIGKILKETRPHAQYTGQAWRLPNWQHLIALAAVFSVKIH